MSEAEIHAWLVRLTNTPFLWPPTPQLPRPSPVGPVVTPDPADNTEADDEDEDAKEYTYIQQRSHEAYQRLRVDFLSRRGKTPHDDTSPWWDNVVRCIEDG